MLSTRLPIRQIERAAKSPTLHLPRRLGWQLSASWTARQSGWRILPLWGKGKILTVSYKKYYFVSLYRLSGSINFAWANQNKVYPAGKESLCRVSALVLHNFDRNFLSGSRTPLYCVRLVKFQELATVATLKYPIWWGGLEFFFLRFFVCLLAYLFIFCVVLFVCFDGK